MNAFYKAVTKMSAQFHPRAHCQVENCPWEYEESSHTKKCAREHVKITGHTVSIVQETYSEVGPA